MPEFLSTRPSSQNYWRGIVLLGRNVASYKFALAKSLLELATERRTKVTLEELAIPYTRHLTEHLKRAEKQITSRSSQFLEVCRDFNNGAASQTQLVDAAVNMGFNNVLDAFHVVNNGAIPVRFFEDERRARKGIVLTDPLLSLAAESQAANLPLEVEARWRLVETAWALDLPASLLAVHYDGELESLFVQTADARINVTACRDALNGYQKGKCFYCFRNLFVSFGSEANADVDHFFPLGLARFRELGQTNLNGVWNLVLACEDCNRGPGGKFMRVPATRYLERLHKRNQFFIESHHPLRETLINQTGQTERARRDYLQRTHAAATVLLLHEWRCPHELEAEF